MPAASSIAAAAAGLLLQSRGQQSPQRAAGGVSPPRHPAGRLLPLAANRSKHPAAAAAACSSSSSTNAAAGASNITVNKRISNNSSSSSNSSNSSSDCEEHQILQQHLHCHCFSETHMEGSRACLSGDSFAFCLFTATRDDRKTSLCREELNSSNKSGIFCSNKRHAAGDSSTPPPATHVTGAHRASINLQIPKWHTKHTPNGSIIYPSSSSSSRRRRNSSSNWSSNSSRDIRSVFILQSLHHSRVWEVVGPPNGDSCPQRIPVSPFGCLRLSNAYGIGSQTLTRDIKQQDAHATRMHDDGAGLMDAIPEQKQQQQQQQQQQQKQLVYRSCISR